ncbi:hypothetical protein ACQ4PT_038992 [Festuca glaucescens]
MGENPKSTAAVRKAAVPTAAIPTAPDRGEDLPAAVQNDGFTPTGKSWQAHGPTLILLAGLGHVDVLGHCAALTSEACPKQLTPLGPADFKLVRRVGGGDIGTVYLCRLRTAPEEEESSPCCLYAMKVVDRRLVAKKRKLERAAAERRILRLLDHPFLPTLFADFDAAPRFSCVVTEFCPGGDLHSLRHRMPSRRFPPASARFYAAEVLLALEYLHMMGVVYRDLKPENVLIRADGHIMLTDFDLSLESTSSPSLELPAPAADDDDEEPSAASCFPLRFKRRQRRPRRCAASSPPRFVAEPVWASLLLPTVVAPSTGAAAAGLALAGLPLLLSEEELSAGDAAPLFTVQALLDCT